MLSQPQSPGSKVMFTLVGERMRAEEVQQKGNANRLFQGSFYSDESKITGTSAIIILMNSTQYRQM